MRVVAVRRQPCSHLRRQQKPPSAEWPAWSSVFGNRIRARSSCTANLNLARKGKKMPRLRQPLLAGARGDFTRPCVPGTHPLLRRVGVTEPCRPRGRDRGRYNADLKATCVGLARAISPPSPLTMLLAMLKPKPVPSHCAVGSFQVAGRGGTLPPRVRGECPDRRHGSSMRTLRGVVRAPRRARAPYLKAFSKQIAQGAAQVRSASIRWLPVAWRWTVTSCPASKIVVA